MKVRGVLLVGAMGITCVFAASDPFVGKWVWNREKSLPPKIKYQVKDLGGNRFAFTGADGQTITIKPDGNPVEVPVVGSVTVRKIDDHNWRMTKSSPIKTDRTITISADEKSMAMKDVYTFPDGKEQKMTTAYRRTSRGKGFVGEWESISRQDQFTEGSQDVEVESYGKDGLSLIGRAVNYRLDLNFDGKRYFDKGPTVAKGTSTSGKRVNAHLIELEIYINDVLDTREENRLSDDGKTLTVIDRSVESGAVFTNVYNKH